MDGTRNNGGGGDDEPHEAIERAALIFSAPETRAVGEEFVECLIPAVPVVDESGLAQGTRVASRRERLAFLCPAFTKLVSEAANCSDFSDVVMKLDEAFATSAEDDQRSQRAGVTASGTMGVNPHAAHFPEAVVRANCGELSAVQQELDTAGGNALSMVLIETDDETQNVLVVILGGHLANLLNTGVEQQCADILDDPDEGPHQASLFKVTIYASPRPEEGDDTVYSATIMADVDITRETLLAKFCEAQNWPGQPTVNHFLQRPILDEGTLQHVVCGGIAHDVQAIEGTAPVFTQCSVPDDQDYHAALLFKVRLTVPVVEFNTLTVPDGGSQGPPDIQDDCWPKQKEVAKRLFKKTDEVLGNRCISDFKGVEFVVLTPAFQTIQQQTINRLASCGVLPPGKVASECVIMYIRSAQHDQLFERFKTRVRDNKDVLFVFVADHCDYGCMEDRANDKYVNDKDLRDSGNFVLLGVSATPYNCLTNKSRVQASNVIEWFEGTRPREEGIYRSMEYYLGTIAFRPDPGGCTLRVEVVPVTGQSSSFIVDIRNKAFVSPDQVAEALSTEIAGKITQHCENASMVVRYSAGEQRFSVQNMRGSFTFRLGSGQTSVLVKLGFTSDQLPLELAPGVEIHANPTWVIGNHDQPGGRSLEDQRIRTDPGFTELRARFFSEFERRGGKKRKSNDIFMATDNDPQTSVALHDGHLLLAEYLFSLVCLSMFRKEGLTLRMKSPDNGPVTEAFLNQHVTDDCVDGFTERLDDVCSFNVGTESNPCICGIHAVMEFVTKTYISQAREELQNNPHDDRSCLRYILREKLRAGAGAENTSEEYSWFNETDRILRDLLRGDSDRGHGRMVVMRVYEREEQLSMQHCLRQARQKLLLYDGPTDGPLFSVVCDNGDTNLSQDIEEYFRNSFNLRADGDGQSTLNDRMMELRNLPGSRNISLSYEDLLNVPMILILCEKGRMGDTFPHSLGCFDLRLRVAGFFSSFEQELGRLCRYPEFRPIDGGSGPSHGDVQTLGRNALSRKRLVKVSTPAGLVSVVDTWWQLDSALASVAANDVVKLEESVFPLPTALVPCPTMRKLINAVDEHRMTGTPISKCIRMSKMDVFMQGSTTKKSKPITATENVLHKYSAYSPGKRHFDHRRGQSDPKDPRR